MSKSISASLGLISMLAALACSSTGGSEGTKPSNAAAPIGSLESAQLADGGVDVGDAGDAGLVVIDAGDAAL
jgi:hypothetical protein